MKETIVPQNSHIVLRMRPDSRLLRFFEKRVEKVGFSKSIIEKYYTKVI
jgi:hypothetical protein